MQCLHGTVPSGRPPGPQRQQSCLSILVVMQPLPRPEHSTAMRRQSLANSAGMLDIWPFEEGENTLQQIFRASIEGQPV